MGRKKINQGICSVDDCISPVKTRQLCGMHYHRWQRHQNVNCTKKTFGQGATREARFWSCVAVTANPEKCWEWQGMLAETGYGAVTFRGRSQGAHRVAWSIANGKLPTKHILHSCDNRKCVNPAHLREGTPLDNYQDMVIRNRRVFTRGEGFGFKLKEADVLAIRKDSRSQSAISLDYEISQSAVSLIKNRKLWTHI